MRSFVLLVLAWAVALLSASCFGGGGIGNSLNPGNTQNPGSNNPGPTLTVSDAQLTTVAGSGVTGKIDIEPNQGVEGDRMRITVRFTANGSKVAKIVAYGWVVGNTEWSYEPINDHMQQSNSNLWMTVDKGDSYLVFATSKAFVQRYYCLDSAGYVVAVGDVKGNGGTAVGSWKTDGLYDDKENGGSGGDEVYTFTDGEMVPIYSSGVRATIDVEPNSGVEGTMVERITVTFTSGASKVKNVIIYSFSEVYSDWETPLYEWAFNLYMAKISASVWEVPSDVTYYTTGENAVLRFYAEANDGTMIAVGDIDYNGGGPAVSWREDGIGDTNRHRSSQAAEQPAVSQDPQAAIGMLIGRRDTSVIKNASSTASAQ